MNKEFNLTDIGDWNQENIDNTFFNDAPGEDGITAEEVVKQIEKDEEKELPNKEDKVKEPEINWEDDNPNIGAETVETPAKPGVSQKKEVENATVKAAQMLIDKGILEIELEEGEELDEDIALELIEEGYNAAVDVKIEELMQELPTELQALNKFVLAGGDMNEFLSKLNTVGKTSGITATLDISDEKNQELVVREMYQQDGMDSDFIETQIESLKDTGKLETFAKKRFEKWKEQDTKNSRKIAEEQGLIAKQQREKARQYLMNLKSSVAKDMDGIKLSTKDKNEIPTYMTERNIKLQNGAVVTQFNFGLMEVMQNETASIQLAKLLRDRKRDGTFDFSQLEKVAATKVVKEVKENIRRNRETPNKSVEVNPQSKSLADYLTN